MKSRPIRITAAACGLCVLLLAACATTDKADLRRREVAWRDLGKQYFLAGDHTTALKYLTDAEKLYPDDHILQNYLGQVYLAKEKPDLAIVHYRRAIELKPDYAVAKNNLGVALLAEKKWDEAITVFEEVSTDLLYATPHYPLTNLGFAYYSKGDYISSEQAYLKALKIDPEYPPALRGLGRTYVAMGRAPEAVRVLNEVVERHPEFGEAYYDLGNAYLLLRDYPKAKEAYQRAVVLAPDTESGREAKKALAALRYVQ